MYEHCTLHYKGKKYRKRVHRLMAEAFFKNAKVIDHIDNNKSNNHIENLRAVTHSENIKKSYVELKSKSQYKGGRVPVVAVDKNTGEKFTFKSMRECERSTGVDRHRIKTFLDGTVKNYTNYNFYYHN